MKEVTKKELPEISGGEYPQGPFGPCPVLDYPTDPVVPAPDTTTDA